MGNRIRLLRLELSHFKGLAAFTFAPGGLSATVRGDNGAGKTTLLDAWTWLLSGKDSQGRQDCSVKTRGKESADHVVEAMIEVDGAEVVLRRTYREKWVRRRGAPDAELQGHTTTYEIDGEPLKQKEWDARLVELLPEHTWLLTLPGAFAALHWQDRRRILVELAGDVGQADVIASTPALSELPEVLGTRIPEAQRKIAKRSRDAANKLLNELPARVDEVTRQLAPLDDLDGEALRSSLAAAEAAIAAAKAGIDEGPARERAALETKRRELSGRIEADRRAAEHERSTKARTLRQTVARRNAEQIQANTDAAAAGRLAEGHETRRLDLRRQWHHANQRQVSVPGTCTCAACGDTHAVAPERVEAARNAANLDKAERLAKIQQHGQETVAQAQRCREDAALHRETAEACASAIAAAQAQLAALDVKPEPHEQQADLDALDAELATLAERTPEPPDASEHEAEAARCRADLARLDGAKGLRERLAELTAERKRSAGELERHERALYLLDLFASTQAELLEDRVNGMFELARFRLSEPQINGASRDCCDVLVDGVPVGGGLNYGAEVCAGLDIVNVLSKAWGCSVPVWLDMAAEVTRPLDIGTQMIRLVADITKPKLEVTCDN